MQKEKIQCPVMNVFSFLGKRWTLLILRSIIQGNKNFNLIKKSLSSISSRTLAERLKELEEHGYIEKNITSKTPIKIEYGLSEKTKKLEKILDQMGEFACEWK